jgi:hypothetical protein
MTVKTSMTTIALLIAILVFANAQGSITGTRKAEDVGFAP